MFNLRKCVLGVLVIVLLGVTSSAFAFTTTEGGGTFTKVVEISISGLNTLDLAAFDVMVEYDNAFVNTDGHEVTDELGIIGDGDEAQAWDWSGASDDNDGFYISVVSFLTDFSSQSDSFVLGTITVSGDDEEDLAAINLDDLSYIDLVDQNNEWISDYTVETTANGFNISVNSASPVPVPSAFTLLAFGLTSLTMFARRRA